MSTSIDMQYGDFNTLLTGFMALGIPIEKKDEVIKLMEFYGLHFGDNYVILYNEYYEEYNNASALCIVLDKRYGLKSDEDHGDSFDVLLNLLKEKENLGVGDGWGLLRSEEPEDEKEDEDHD